MRKSVMKIIFLILFLISVFFISRFTGISTYLEADNLRESIEDMGAFSYVIYTLLYAVITVLMFPGTPFSILAGVIFGGFIGSLIVLIGATSGSLVAFLISRYLGKDFIAGYIEKRIPKLGNLDKKLGDNGFVTMVLLRLIPIMPYNGLNYASGLSRIKFRDYALGSFIGMIPGVFILVNIGASATDLSDPLLYILITVFLLMGFLPSLYKKITHKKSERVT